MQAPPAQLDGDRVSPQQTELETLYRLHAADLLRFLERRCAGAGEPEDLLQQTFVEAARHADRWRTARSARAWLFGVARHVAMAAARRLRLRATRALPAELASETAGEPDPRLEALREAMNALSPTQRETLELRIRDGLSYAEIAEMLDVPIGTVRSRLHQAVARLSDAVGRRTGSDKHEA